MYPINPITDRIGISITQKDPSVLTHPVNGELCIIRQY